MGLGMSGAQVAAMAMGVLGLGLVAAAFIGSSFGPLRLFFGLGLVVTALITAGLQMLVRNAAPTAPGEDA